MNISQLAKASQISTDTLRFYEKQGLLQAAGRAANGYRRYGPEQLETLRFIRGAQALGFSLKEVAAILPQLAQGQFGRAEIESRLLAKMAEIDGQLAQLQQLKSELSRTFASLRCEPASALSARDSTAADSGSGAGVAVLKRRFSR